MAKKIIQDENGSPIEEQIEDLKENTSVTSAVNVEKTNAKNVKIRTTSPVYCLIGKVRYDLQKDKEYSVPTDVAAILTIAEQAFRI